MRAVGATFSAVIGGLCGVQKWGVPISSGADSLWWRRGMGVGTKGGGFNPFFLVSVGGGVVDLSPT